MLLDNLSLNACFRRTYSAASVQTILDVVQARSGTTEKEMDDKYGYEALLQEMGQDLLASIRTR